MKRAMFLIGGACWLLFAAGFGFFLVLYLTQGAGLECFDSTVSAGSVSMGLVPVVGLVAASVLCFIVGAGLCAHGIVNESQEEAE